MKPSAILSSDILDIIFENRNKSYGAYALRKDYNSRLLKALMIVACFLGLASFLLLSGEIKKPENNPLIAGPTLETQPNEPPAEPEKPKPKPATAAVATYNNNPPVIVENARADSSLPTSDMTDAAVPGNETKPGDPAVPGIVPGDDVGKPSELVITEPAKPAIDKNIPVDHVDIQPSYPGGLSAFTKYLQRNLHSPEDIEPGAVVSVRVKFIVQYDGNLRAFEVVESGGESFDMEVLRVLKKMSKWIPGKTSGEDVSVFYVVPVKFTAE